MGPALIGRMRALGAVANIQPSFVGTDSKWVQARLAPHVQVSSYCWKVRSGALMISMKDKVMCESSFLLCAKESQFMKTKGAYCPHFLSNTHLCT